MSAAAASFRHRLQRQHTLHHIQTQNIPPPAPWSSGSEEAYTAPPTTNHRPPLSPRGYSSAAATTGQSRFVEGSMNDRVSAAPPPGFLGVGFGEEELELGGSGEGGEGEEKERGDDRRSDGSSGIGIDRPPRLGKGLGRQGAAGERRLRYQDSRQLQREYRLSEPVSAGPGPVPGLGYGYEAGGGTTSGRYHLRRPRSTAGWVTTQAAAAVPPPQQQGAQRGGVVKKTSFLAPLWDGVREKLHLNKSKSSGSIGRVMNSVVGERRVERERERERATAPVLVAGAGEERDKVPPIQSPSMAGYPSREEVLESYKNLVASGFFEQHAIRGGRHPLRTGGNGPPQEKGKSFADHMASPGTPQTPGGRSFAEHMAAPGTPISPSGKSFADHMAAQQQRPGPPLSSPIRNRMGPPPPRGSSHGKRDTIPSPQRGTKRGASLDFAGDAEMVTRKLVKKLRHSASRISVELTGGREHYHYSYGTSRSRRSTSSNRPGPLSPTASVFSSIASPRSSIADDTASIRRSKLTKPKDGHRRRILGITRRNRSPAPTAAAPTDADPDAMVVDEPERQPQPEQRPQPESATTEQLPKVHRTTYPRTTYPRNTLRGGSTLKSVQQDEPLSIAPDANQGIPFVPRIPREFCDAMAAMAPPAAAVVAASGEVKKEEVKAKAKAKAKGKNGNRDSGLGEDVENIPVWG